MRSSVATAGLRPLSSACRQRTRQRIRYSRLLGQASF
jgi:hypothetical protein